MSSRRRIAICLSLATVALGCVGLAASTSAQADGQAQTTVQQVAQGYLTTVTYPDGDATTVFASTPVTITSGATSTTTPDGGEDTTTGDPIGTEVSGTVTPDVTAGAKTMPPASSITAVQELEAMGVSPADAATFASFDAGAPTANGGGPNGGIAPTSTTHTTSATHTASSTTVSGTTHAPESPDTGVSPSQMYGPPLCASSYADGRRIYMYGCDEAYRVYARGNDWYLEDRYEATVISRDQAIFDADVVTGLVFGDQYVKGNVLYTWQPAQTKPEGSCTTYTSTITVQGYSASEESQECPETFGPYQYGTTIYTSKWDGQGNGPNNEARAVTGVSGWHNPPGVAPKRSLVWRYWYD